MLSLLETKHTEDGWVSAVTKIMNANEQLSVWAGLF